DKSRVTQSYSRAFATHKTGQNNIGQSRTVQYRSIRKSAQRFGFVLGGTGTAVQTTKKLARERVGSQG
ncbi:MAG: hypothetical protein ACPGVP_20365, partial [Thiolinea sp.]